MGRIVTFPNIVRKHGSNLWKHIREVHGAFGTRRIDLRTDRVGALYETHYDFRRDVHQFFGLFAEFIGKASWGCFVRVSYDFRIPVSTNHRIQTMDDGYRARLALKCLRWRKLLAYGIISFPTSPAWCAPPMHL